jgi:hypothetical protein
MENLESSDLDVQLNMGLVCTGKLRDLTTLRDVLRKTVGVKVVFNTLSSEYLFIIKKTALSPEQQTNFNKKEP